MEPDDYETPSGYLKALLQRTQDLRIKREITQADAAELLGLKLDAYKKYETRSPLPHHLIHKFCVLVGSDETFFLTGKSATQKKAIRKKATVRFPQLPAGEEAMRLGRRDGRKRTG